MKQLFTLLFIAISALGLSAQGFSKLNKQKVALDSNRKVKQLLNYYSFPSSVYYLYNFEYNPDGRLTTVSLHSYQGFGSVPYYKKPDTTEIQFKLTFKYNAKGQKSEETFYDNYRRPVRRCIYEYKGDTAITVTKLFYFNTDVDMKIVYKLHKIKKTVTGTQNSGMPELYEKVTYGEDGKPNFKVRYSYGPAMAEYEGFNAHYGPYAALYLNSIKAYDGKGKLLQERKRIKVETDGEIAFKDTTIVHKDTDDGYDVAYEDVYFYQKGNHQYTFDDDNPTTTIDYLNTLFDKENRRVSTGMWWDQTEYEAEDIEERMLFADDDLMGGYEVVEDK